MSQPSDRFSAHNRFERIVCRLVDRAFRATPLVVALIAFCRFPIFLLLACTVAYAKRDVHMRWHSSNSIDTLRSTQSTLLGMWLFERRNKSYTLTYA